MDENKGNSGLEKKKSELIEAAKHLDRIIYGKTCEMKALLTVLGTEKPVPPAGRVRAELEKLEFKVATEAYTLALERTLLKSIKKKKEELEAAVAAARKRGRARFLEQGLTGLQKQRKEIEAKIQEVKGEMVKIRRKAENDEHRQEKAVWHAAREQVHRKEIEKYAGEAPSGLELGDIAIIRKKKEG